ncbi:hypothetical protein IE53DRAFT_385983 [Violaceomyces palustris]|uniref:Uncharacterized protein n=1 Tax=Violaceomyces palustris TaxID=1673888 RepID=A0ACD0P0Z3_9BASI|nr:hypothetical protein IE53DRAFT_385983 [Violaceomyces palustris]
MTSSPQRAESLSKKEDLGDSTSSSEKVPTSTLKDLEYSRDVSDQRTDQGPGVGEARVAKVDGNGRAIHTIRGMKPRHLQLMAIGGTIGTGLFVGTGGALIDSGPLSLLLGFILYSGMVWCVSQCTGEITTMLPLEGGFTHHSGRFVDPAVGFAQSWNYVYGTMTFLCAELSAISGLFSYWAPEVSPAVWISIGLVVIFTMNCMGSRVYGECEFWFASFKVILILGLIMMTFIMMVGGNPQHEAFGFTYWRNPGPMAEFIETGPLGRFLGLWNTLIFAAFAIGGPEYISIAAGEAINPREVIPKAIRRVFWRLCFFYIVGALCVGILVAYNDPALIAATSEGKGAAASPFVVALKNRGIGGLDHLINALILTSAWSCGSSFTFCGVRGLHSMSLDGRAPKIFSRTIGGTPIFALLFMCSVGLLSFMVVDQGSAKVFSWFVNLSACSSLLNYILIIITWLRFNEGLKAQGIPRSSLPFRGLFMPYSAWISLVGMTLITLFNGFEIFIHGHWDLQGFFTAYFGLGLFLVLFVGWKLVKRTSFIKPSEMDFHSGKAEIDLDQAYWEANKVAPTTAWQKFVEWLL